jgi:uncharacterized protein YuzE
MTAGMPPEKPARERPTALSLGDVVLDVDERGRLLGVEFLDGRALPPDLSASQVFLR